MWQDSELPYAWVNLKHGVERAETRETCTAGVGTLLLEFGLLSHFTGDPQYFEAVDRAMTKLWGMKSSIGLFGNTFDGLTGEWKNTNSGIGAGAWLPPCWWSAFHPGVFCLLACVITRSAAPNVFSCVWCAGIDSFYEYLLKAYILFGNSKFYDWFKETYAAVNKHLKTGMSVTL